jgi:glutamyl/glutaminyl-tRNA synthetase
VTKTFLSDDFNHISDDMKLVINTPDFWKNLAALEKILIDVNKINLENGNDIVNQVKALTQLNGKSLYFPIRFAAIGQEHGPEMNKILVIVGKDSILKNIDIIKNKFK